MAALAILHSSDDEGRVEGEWRSADARANAGEGWRGGVGNRPQKGRCSRIGRGHAAADRLKRSAEQRGPSERMGRVLIKARIDRLKRGSKGAEAHLRYLQLDGRPGKGSAGGCMGQIPTRSTGGSLWSAGGRTAISSVSMWRPRTATGFPIYAPSPAMSCARWRTTSEPDSTGSRSIISTLAIYTAM